MKLLCLACHRFGTALMRPYRSKQSASNCLQLLDNYMFTNRFLVFGKQTYTREAAAIVFEIFCSITLQENTWTTRNKDSTQIYT